jgi:fructuronate reductase
MAERIAALVRNLDDPEEIVAAFVGLTEVFGDDLRADGHFRSGLVGALSRLLFDGSATVLQSQRRED